MRNWPFRKGVRRPIEHKNSLARSHKLYHINVRHDNNKKIILRFVSDNTSRSISSKKVEGEHRDGREKTKCIKISHLHEKQMSKKLIKDRVKAAGKENIFIAFLLGLLLLGSCIGGWA